MCRHKMFQSARIKLTVWYLLILMSISIIFSGVIYNIVSHQIEELIHSENARRQHFQHDIQNGETPPPPHQDDPVIPVQDLQNQQSQLFITLIIVNGIIFFVAGGAAYFLAGRTLRPIQLMIDEQNQFITSASHELRTPIATMRTEMETTLLEHPDKKTQALITSNLEELQSLQTLTNNLLQLAQVHNSTPQTYIEKISLPEVIQTAYKKVLPLAKKKHLPIHQKVQDATLIGDKNSLIEVFVILLENAIKYSSDKTTITIATGIVKHTLQVHVVDQGIGIDAKDLPYIFNRFYRADKVHSQEGFGLGLSIAKKIIDMHHGTIQVNSVIGTGTTFTVSFPLASLNTEA